MKVKELKKLLEDKPDGMTLEEFDNLSVLVSLNGEFDGHFVDACSSESGVCQMGIEEDSEETVPNFLIVKHGFFDEKTGVPCELN